MTVRRGLSIFLMVCIWVAVVSVAYFSLIGVTGGH